MPTLVVTSSTLKSCFCDNTYVVRTTFQIKKQQQMFCIIICLLSSSWILVVLQIQIFLHHLLLLTTTHDTIIFHVIFSHNRSSCFKTRTETITQDNDVTEIRTRRASDVCSTSWLFHNSSRWRQNTNTAVQVHGRFLSWQIQPFT